jgi:hypothetical protein
VDTVTPLDLRRSLGRILDEASAGKRFLIERDRRPLAVLVSVEDAARLDEHPDEARERRLAAVAALEDWRERALSGAVAEEVPFAAEEAIRADRDARDRRDRMRAGDRSVAEDDRP